ncbi:MAG: hypothetical protein ACRDJN_19790 [Chloroflexota bacterium]
MAAVLRCPSPVPASSIPSALTALGGPVASLTAGVVASVLPPRVVTWVAALGDLGFALPAVTRPSVRPLAVGSLRWLGLFNMIVGVASLWPFGRADTSAAVAALSVRRPEAQ